MHVIYANGVDPDQTLRSVASDLGIHCFQYPFCGTLGVNGLSWAVWWKSVEKFKALFGFEDPENAVKGAAIFVSKYL